MKFILFTLLAAWPLLNFDSHITQEPMLQLKSCPKSPNCVCTQDSIKRKQAEPLSYSDSSEKAIIQLKNLIREYENATLVNEKQNYMHYEFVTKLGKFTDDVEFLLDPENKMIHFRSASRTGYGDFGKNKRRMKGVQKKWELLDSSE